MSKNIKILQSTKIYIEVGNNPGEKSNTVNTHRKPNENLL